MSERPAVTVAVAMLNEIDHIGACLDGFAAQTWPLDRLEVLVLDGGSTDGSRELVDARARSAPWLRVLDNPGRSAPAAWNFGLAAATGRWFGIFSAHGVPEADFVEQSVRVIEETGAVGVGGRYEHRGADPVSNAVGLAMVSPLGMASPHRSARKRCNVDTISHPLYVTEALRRIGGFDERLLRNEDYELNWRLREVGGQLVFDPAIVSIYRPRDSLPALARQFWWYGRFKARVMRAHPHATRPRHLAPPLAVATLAASPWWARCGTGRLLALGAAATYAAGVVEAVRRAQPARHRASVTAMAAAFPAMHLSWGAGVLVGLVESARGR